MINDLAEFDAIIFTCVYSKEQIEKARLLFKSLKEFGGDLKFSPIWVFEADLQHAPCDALSDLGARIIPLDTPDPIRIYEYGAKVAACARAEELAADKTRSLIWISPENLVIQPPELLTLSRNYLAAFRPVHFKNVGLGVDEPLDEFWRGIYQKIGIEDISISVESFIEATRIRAYYNSASFVIDPGQRLLERWLQNFQALVVDDVFQKSACQDEKHQVFLYQAVLSTLAAIVLGSEKILLLPPDYIYPYNLHNSVPPERKAPVMNELVSVYYGDRQLNPGAVEDILILEPLRKWLLDNLDR